MDHSKDRSHDSESPEIEKHCSILETCLKSLPLYSLTEVKKLAREKKPRVVALGDKESRKAALVLDEDLLETITAFIQSSEEVYFQEDKTTADNAVLSHFINWAKGRVRELTERLEEIEEESGQEDAKELLENKIVAVERRLDFADRLTAQAEQRFKQAKQTADRARNHAAARLTRVLLDHGLIQIKPEYIEDYKPNPEFLEEWKVPTPEEESEDPFNPVVDASVDDEVGGERPMSGLPIASSLGLSSTESAHARRIEANKREQAKPSNVAEREFVTCRNNLLQVRAQFDRRRETAILLENRDDSSEAGRRNLQEDINLTRQLVDAEEKFREARRKAQNLGVPVQFTDQTSSFIDDPDCEERFKAAMTPYVGPDKYPRIQKWAEKISEIHFVDSVFSNQDGFTRSEPEVDEWEFRPVGNESRSIVDEGRGRMRIEQEEEIKEGLREDVRRLWAKRLKKRKGGFEEVHQGCVRGKRRRG